MTLRRLFVALIAIATILFAAAPASAHARLVSSTPVGGSHVTESPDEIVLEFSEPIEASFGGVQVFAPDGERVPAGEPQISGGTVTLDVEELPSPGDYTVAFRIISADSHPVESRFAFAYRPPEASPSPSPAFVPPSPADPGPRVLDVELQTAGPLSAVGLWLSRFVNYLATTFTVGFLLAGLFLFSGRGETSAEQRNAFSMAGKAGLVWVLSAATLFVFGLSVAAALGLGEALQGDLPGRFAGTRLGRMVLAQAALALLAALLALIAARRSTRAPAVLAAVIVAAALLAPGLWGHAGTARLELLALVSDWAHLAAVTAWVGGLMVLSLFVLAPGWRTDPAEPSARFSKLAGVAVFVVLLSGAINAVMRIGSVGQLFDTEWGRLVLLKVLLFAVIAFLGYRNRNRMLPALRSGAKRAREGFRKLAAIEVGIMVLSFATATALASTIPSDAEAASRIQTVVTTFGPGQINLTVDPAATGENVVHLYFLSETGQPLVVTEPSLSFAMPATSIEAQLFDAGPGHYTVLSQRFERPGSYNVAVSAAVEGQRHTATGTINVR